MLLVFYIGAILKQLGHFALLYGILSLCLHGVCTLLLRVPRQIAWEKYSDNKIYMSIIMVCVFFSIIQYHHF